MKLIGFGCSFTYGSELVDPALGEYCHHANTHYREQNCWLGQLAKRYNCTHDNLAQPANSNFAIAQQVAEYFRSQRESLIDLIVCVAWTERTRMSWYDNKWTHNGFVNSEDGWTDSCREWVLRQTSSSHDLYTENAKLIVNSLCMFNNVPIIQFNALGVHKSQPYSNYLANGGTMEGWLKQRQAERNKNYFASGGHPNEDGHRTWVDEILGEWITAKKLL
jgi:hypothetical protein